MIENTAFQNILADLGNDPIPRPSEEETDRNPTLPACRTHHLLK